MERRTHGHHTARDSRRLSRARRFLDGGKRFCFLYNDLSNPTSNKIYRRLGYEPICDMRDYFFGEREA